MTKNKNNFVLSLASLSPGPPGYPYQESRYNTDILEYGEVLCSCTLLQLA